MPENVNFTFTGDSSQLAAATQRAEAELAKLNYSIASGAATASALAGPLATATANLDQLRAAAAGVTTGLGTVAAAATGLGAAGNTAAAGLGVLGVAARNTGSEVRELTFIFDELVGGRFARLPGSLAVLANYSGVTRAAFAALGTTTGIIGAGFVAVAGAAAYLAYELYEDVKNIDQVTGALALQGRAFEGTRDQLESLRDTFRDTFNTSRNEAREMVSSLGAIPGASQATTRALGDIAKTIQAATGSDAAKTYQEVEKAARAGASGIAKLADSLGAQLDPNVVATAEAMQKAGARFEALEMLAAALQAALSDTTGWAKQKAAIEEWIQSSADLSGYGAMPNLDAMPTVPGRRPVSAPVDRDATNLARESQRIGAATIKQDADRIAIQRELNTLRQREAELRVELAEPRGRADEDTTGRRGAEQRELTQNLAAQAEKEREVNELHTKVDREQYRATMDRYSAQAAQYKADADKALDAERQKYQATLDYAEKPIREADRGLSDAEVRAKAEQLPLVQQQQQRLNEAERNAARQRVELEIQAQREIANEERRGGDERVAAQRRILQLMLENEKEFGPVAIAEQRATIATAERQNQEARYREFKAGAEERIAAARGEVDQIKAIFGELKQAAAGPGAPAGEAARIARQEIDTLRREEQSRFQDVERQVSAEQRLDQMRIGARRATLSAEVSTHAISKAEMEAREAQFTAQVMAGEEQKLQAIIAIPNLEKDQYQRLYDQLAQLYAKDAEQQAQYQAKITADIEAENEKRKKAFTALFDGIGSSLEHSLTGLLTGQTTWAKAIQNVKNSLISGIVSTVSSVASEYAGKQLGPMLGLSAEQSKGGLGNVLGGALFKALGMEKDVPQDAMKGVADKWQKAVDAQQKATDLQGKAAQDLSKAAEALQGAAGRGGTGRTGAAGEGDYGATGEYGGVDTDPRNKAGVVRAAAEKYGIDPNVAVAVARSEGLGTFKGDHGTSFGAMQLHVGGGVGDRFRKETGLDPSDPANEDATIDYAMKVAAREGWGQWHGAQRVGIGNWQGIGTGKAGGADTSFGAAGEYGANQSATQLKASVDKLDSTTKSQTTTLTRANDNSQQLASKITANDASLDQDKRTTDELKATTSDDKNATTANTQAIQALTQKMGSAGTGGLASPPAGLGGGNAGNDFGGGGAPLGVPDQPGLNVSPGTGIASATSSLSGAFGTLTSVVGIAASATSLFGGQMSQTMKMISGGIGLISQVAGLLGGGGGGGGLLSGLGGIGSFFSGIGALFALEGGGIIPSAAGGMVAGGGTLAVLHPREMVLPSAISGGLQSMIAAGGANDNGGATGGDTHNYAIHVHAIDTRSGAQFLMSHSDAIAASLHRAKRNFNARA